MRRAHLVTVERQEELERVLVKDLHGRIEQRDGEESTVGTVSDRENVVRHLESSSMDEGELLRFELMMENDGFCQHRFDSQDRTQRLRTTLSLPMRSLTI